MKNIFISCLLLVVLTGCKKHFKAEKIGWSIELPGKKWKNKTPKEKSPGNINLFKDSDQPVLDETSFEELIVLEKDSSNKFRAALQLYSVPRTSQEYEQMLVHQHNDIRKGYKEKDTPAEFQIGATRIGDKMIDWFDIKVHPADSLRKHTIRIYNCEIRGHILYITISSNNDKDLETLENIVFSSKFSEKK